MEEARASLLQRLVRPAGVCGLEEWDWVAHQCNCTSRRAAGLAARLFELRPEADAYRAGRPRELGGVEVVAGRPGSAGILNLFAQKAPGPPGRAGDSAPERLAAFRACLAAVGLELRRGGLGPCPRGVAFPWRIGCALGGGEWRAYLAELEAFAAGAPCRVFLVLRPADLAG